MRVYLCGSHSVGKTTLARLVSRKYGLPLVNEVARTVLAEVEVPLVSLRTDLDAVGDYQRRVFAAQLAAERRHESFVADRAHDNVVYAAEHTTVLPDIMRSPEFNEYVEWVRGGLVLFLRPERALLKDDGVRAAVDWESVVRIDGMVKFLLEMSEVRYLPIRGENMQERWRAASLVIDAALAAIPKT